MIYVQKEGLPSSIEQEIIEIRKSANWKSIEEEDTDAIRNVFDNIFPKDRVKQILVYEQHGLCAYCMRRIRNDYHSRVEHWYPLKKSKEKSISYDNMLGVCDGGTGIHGNRGRMLCCDAQKGEDEITVSPLNKIQMDKIAYKPDGVMYTEPKDKDMEKDINNILGLNGVKKSDGTRRDTATELLKGRKDAYDRARKLIHRMNVEGKCTSTNVEKLIRNIENQEEYEEYVGVKLFYLKKKLQSLIKQGA